jgi:hypothetical protein
VHRKEAFEALMSGKRIGHPDIDDLIYLLPGGAAFWSEGGYQVNVLGLFLRHEDGWVIEDQAPKVHLNREDVGKIVRLSDGSLAVLSWYDDAKKVFSTLGGDFFLNGKAKDSSDPDIVEVL